MRCGQRRSEDAEERMTISYSFDLFPSQHIQHPHLSLLEERREEGDGHYGGIRLRMERSKSHLEDEMTTLKASGSTALIVPVAFDLENGPEGCSIVVDTGRGYRCGKKTSRLTERFTRWPWPG